ncbi:hypothetical protein D3C85_774990 [compost metagenome]
MQADVLEFAVAAQAGDVQAVVCGAFATDFMVDALQFLTHDAPHQMCTIDIGHAPAFNEGAVAKDAVVVGDLRQLTETVGHINDPGTTGGQAANGLEQRFRFALTNGRGRLVHDHHLTVMAERLGDLYQLDLRHAQAVHRAGGVHVEFQALQQFAGAPVQLLAVDDTTGTPWFAAQPDVLGNRHIGDGFQLLSDHRHSCSQCVTGAVELYRFSVQQNAACVALGDTHEDAEEG